MAYIPPLVNNLLLNILFVVSGNSKITDLFYCYTTTLKQYLDSPVLRLYNSQHLPSVISGLAHSKSKHK